MTEKNLQVRLASRPIGLPKDSDFEIFEEDIPQPSEGEVLVRNVYLSLDPAIRGWMDDRRSYLPPIGLGQVMRGLTVGRVVASKHPDFTTGDAVQGVLGWQLYAVIGGKHLNPVPPGVPLSLALGPLGMTGLTAYFGLLDIGKPKRGETVVVSGAAGAVGSVVGQIAKIKGCRAVGIAGGDNKCHWLTEELGFDAAIDYKTAEDLHEAIYHACPQGVDIYFDNVGGTVLDTALRSLNQRARVVLCGAISQYNNAEEAPKGPGNYLSLLINRARMEGFIVLDYQERYSDALAELGRWLMAGKIRYREDIVDGLENAPNALLKLFDGSNEGKLMVRLSPED